MMQSVTVGSLWDIVVSSTFLSKFILMGASVLLIVCLFIFFYKFMLFREQLSQIKKVRQSLQNATTIQDLFAVGAVLKGTLPGAILGRGLKTLKLSLQGIEGEKRYAPERQIAAVQDSLDQAMADAMHQESSYLPVLSVSAAVSPLIGLFGTISGLIQAFIGIARQRSTDIMAIAPGIAEALLATFAGITVAIAAFVLFHLLNSKLRTIEHELDGLVYQCEMLIQNALGD